MIRKGVKVPGRYSSRERSAYFSADEFLRDLKENTLKEKFILEESVFAEIASRLVTDRELVKEIADNAVLLLLYSDTGDEMAGLVYLAQQFYSENENG